MTVSRPSTVWVTFAICFAIVLAAMGWVTVRNLRLEDERVALERDRELQERVRLALWRMDSAASAIVVNENARPPNHFRDFHSLDQAYTNTLQILQKGTVITPSPLLNDTPAHCNLYCQLGADGQLTSPQVPFGNNRDLAEQNYVSSEEIESAAVLLNKAQEFFSEIKPPGKATAALKDNVPLKFPKTSAQGGQQSWSLEELKNTSEWIKRSETKDKTEALSNNPQQAQIRSSNDLVLQQAEWAGVNVSGPDSAEAFEGVWKNSELFLVRLATLDGREVTQGIWLDSKAIQRMLLDEVGDLLPNAQLLPVQNKSLQERLTQDAIMSRARNLVSLPFRLEPGAISPTAMTFWSENRRSLAVAWACALLAAAAASALIIGIVRLSERRGAFVSAVTHEMRTPLTTFRLYSEMLSGDMVKDDEKRKDYLSTLTSEADRLSHLVENVLSYAQLEKGSARAQVEETTLQAIIDRVLPRLQQRAASAGMEILVDANPEAAAAHLKVDLTAVEQILFNLVDNACKYAHVEEEDASARVIHLEADTDGPMALLRVRDHGRGISKAEERRLFRPFEKSAHEAAHSAPGVGLGLALCRKLTRALGGELRLCRKSAGACFVLAFPALENA